MKVQKNNYFLSLIVLLVCSFAIYLSIPTINKLFNINSSKKYLISEPLNFGLDLVGGLHLLLKIDDKEYYKNKLSMIKDDIKSILVNKEKKYHKGERIKFSRFRVTSERLTFNLRNKGDVSKVIELIQNNIKDIIARADGSLIIINLSDNKKRDLRRELLEQSIKVVRNRIDPNGVKEALIYPQGDNRLVLQIAGEVNIEDIKQKLNVTAKLGFHLADDGRDSKIYHEYDDSNNVVSSLRLKEESELSGEHLVHAQVDYDENRVPVVSIRFDNYGKKKFAEITKNNVGKRLVILLDNKILSSPVINTPIVNGSGIITGNFTVNSASDLALFLRSGALPAKMTVLSEQLVGPSLGNDSIQAGKVATILAMITVMISMFLIYGKVGFIANISIIINIFIILALLIIFNATLTLPGIAGVVLTVGMAVDANILIFERIREESENQTNNFVIIENSFKKAFTTILDSNLTTLIASITLFIFGYGAIKGFAVTLTIGILSSMFSSIFLTRLLILYYFKNRNIKI